MQSQIYQINENKLHSMILKVCHSVEMPLHFNRKGPKIFTNYQRIALIILYKRSKKSLVDFIEEFYETLWPKWLGLREIPGKSTLHDWIKLFAMPVLKVLHKATLPSKKPKIMSIDATGIDSWQRSRHYHKRVEQILKRPVPMPYAKLDAIVDTETMLVYDHVLRMKPRHDVLGAESIFKRNNFENVKVLGDKGYDSESLHELIHDSGGTFFAPVRKSPRKRPKGRFRRMCKLGDEDYSRRNCSESVFHALKQRFAPNLRCRKHHLKKREMSWIIIMYNMMIQIEGKVQSLKLIILRMISYSGCTRDKYLRWVVTTVEF